MERQTYYVSVQAGTIIVDQGASSYEFEIVATPGQVESLQHLIDKKADVELATFIRAPIPGIPYHQDEENDAYDESLIEIYNMLHQLGTESTKEHIEQMGMVKTD